jgi:hypothetical protein
MVLQVLFSPGLKPSPLFEAGFNREALTAIDVVDPHLFNARIHLNLMKELLKQFSVFEVESFPCIQSARIRLYLDSKRVVSELGFGLGVNDENGFSHGASLSLWSVWTVVAPVADGGVGGRHLHLGGVVGVQQVERSPRIVTVRYAKPAVVVPWVKKNALPCVGVCFTVDLVAPNL